MGLNGNNWYTTDSVSFSQNKEDKGVIMEWLSTNWEWVLLGFMVLEKLVKMSPSDKDDILLDVVWQGLTKMVKGDKK
jgi:hypothetical protein|tara:strand:- start:59 stop:289 length:231 start_codon:yes stop_codon:yes gene_type:complete